MKTFIQLSCVLAVLMIATGICNAQTGSNPSSGIGLKVKSGTLVFNVTENGKEQSATFTFDNYGADFRVESGDEVSIASGSTHKAYKLNHANKTYSEENYFSARLQLRLFFFTGDDAAVKKFPEYKKLPNRTVAGKDCMVFSFTDKSQTITVGEWKGLLFLKESQGNDFMANSFSETVSESAFTVPSGYKLAEN